MGKKVRRNSKSRNTKNRNNLRRSKVRRNNSTKKARKQRRGSRKQRGGGLQDKLKESQENFESTEGIKKGIKYYRVWVNLPGIKKKGPLISSIDGRSTQTSWRRMTRIDLDEERLCKELFIIYYSEEAAKKIKMTNILNNFNEISRDGPCVFNNLDIGSANPSVGDTTLFVNLPGEKKSQMVSIDTKVQENLPGVEISGVGQPVRNERNTVRTYDFSIKKVVFKFEKLTGGVIE